MKEFKDAVKLKIIPTTFIFKCSVCGEEITDYDRHFGLIKVNDHMVTKHINEVNSLSKEDLYSRRADISFERFE